MIPQVAVATPIATYIRSFGGEGSGAGQLAIPGGIATDSKGNVWVADTANNRIQEFNSKGEFLSQFGTKGSGDGLFLEPRALALDSEGNVWVADTGNYRVQEFNSKGEFIRKFGSEGTADGKFKSLQGIAVDSKGHVWTIDAALLKPRIQEFNSKGEFIGKFGTVGAENGQLQEPQGIATDSAGNVWVADTANNRVQEFSAEGKFTRKFGSAGTGSGQFKAPAALSVNPEGNVWVADTGNNRVQEFDSEGKYLSQFGSAGNDDGQLSEPKGIAADPEGNVWVADTGNNRIQESTTSEFIRKFGGEGSEAGQLSAPGGIAVDAEGNTWVADSGHNRIQEFNSKGEFIRQFGAKGSGDGLLSEPQGIAIDASGNVWVADTGNYRVQEFNAKGKFIRKIGSKGASSGQFLALQDLAVDSESHIWTVEPSETKPRVQEFNAKGEFIRKIGPSLGTGNGQFKEPQGIAADAKGNVWVADTGNNRVQEFNPKGEYIRKFGSEGTGSGQLKSPSALAIDPEGKLWVADTANNRMQRFTVEGEYLSQFGTAGNDDGQFSEPQGIATDSKGNVWVADTSNDRVQASTASEFVRKFGGEGSGAGRLSAPAGIVTDSKGNAWVADTGHDRIQEFDSAGEFIRQFGAKGSGNGQFSEPRGIATDSKGNVWVADSDNHRLQEFNPKGEYIRKFGSAGKEGGQFESLEDVAIDPEGRLWTVESSPSRVQEFAAEGKFLGQFGSSGTGNGQLKQPKGIATDAKGNVWVADTGNNRVQEFNPKGEYIRKFGSEGTGSGQLKSPSALAIDPEGNVWVTDTGNNRVQKFNAKGTYLGQVGTVGNNPGQFSGPQGIAADPKGTIWVADTGNNRVQEWLIPGYTPSYVSAFGTSGAGNGQFEHPADVASDAEGNIWVVDQNNYRVEEFSESGEYRSQFGSYGTGNGQFGRPTALAIDAAGSIWVTDADNDRVQEFNEEGEYLGKFGSEGEGNGQFYAPEGIAIDAEGNIWVSDTYNGRLQEFDEEGKFVKVVSSYGSEEGQLGEPTGIDVDSSGNVWVAEWQNNRISEFSEGGDFVRQFGSAGSGNGQFASPDALAIDEKGNVWVGDEGNDRIQKFSDTGRYLTQFGTEGTGEGQFNFGWPMGIAADSQGDIWVTDSENNRVQRWQIPAGPDTAISGGPKGVVVPNVSFSFTSSDTGLSFECSIDGGTYSVCSSPKSYTSLAAGPHTFRVRALDADSNQDEIPAERSFEVAKPPTVSTGGVTGVGSSEATLHASINPNGIEATYQFEYGPTTAYGKVMPAVAKSAGSDSQDVAVARLVTSLEVDTTYHFRIAATNGSGTVHGSDETFTTLQASPVLLLVFGQAAESPSGALVSPEQPLSISAGNENGKIEELQLRIDGETNSTTTRQEALEEGGTESCFEGVCTLDFEYPSAFPADITSGEHTFEVRAIGVGGQEATFTRQVLVDVGVPILELGGTLVEANGNLSSSYSSATVTASAQDGAGAYDSGLSSIEFYVDGVYQSGLSAQCDEGCPAEGSSEYEYLEQKWGTGPHELTVVARDAAGNEASDTVMVNQHLDSIEPTCSAVKATAAAVGEAVSTAEATEAIEATLPAAVAPPTPDPEAEGFEPTLTEGEAASEGAQAFLAQGGLVGGRVVHGSHRAFTIGQASCLVPMQTTKAESAPEVLAVSGTVVYANTAPETDTFLRNNGVGATIVESFRGPNAPTSLSWTISLTSGQRLEELASGAVAIVSSERFDLPEAQVPSQPLGMNDPEMLGDTETVLDAASYELRRANNEVEGAVEAVIPPVLVIASSGAVETLLLTVAEGERVVASVPAAAKAMVMRTYSSPRPEAICAAAFEEDPADYANGCLPETDEGGERPYITAMDWAPDGSFVYAAFWDEYGTYWEKMDEYNAIESFLYRASPDGSEVEELETPGFKVLGAPKISPDGTKIVFNGCSLVSFKCGVVLTDASGENGTLLVATEGHFKDSWMGFSGNGNRILYEEPALNGPNGHEERQLYSMKLDGTEKRQLTDISAYWGITRIQPYESWEGRGVLGHSAVAAGPSSHTLVLEGGGYGLYAMNQSQEKADLSNMTRLTDTLGEAPAFNPSGTKIAYSYGGGKGKSGIFVMNADGSNAKLVVSTPWPWEERALYPVYSHDGSEIAYIRNGLIYRVPAAGGSETLAVESDTSGFRTLSSAIAKSDPADLPMVEAVEEAYLASSSSSSEDASGGLGALEVVEKMNKWEIEFCLAHFGECKAFADDRALALNARGALFTNRNKEDRSTKGNAFQHGFWTALMVRDSVGEYEGLPNGLLFALHHETKPYNWDARQDIVNDLVGYIWYFKDGIEIVKETESEVEVHFPNKLEICQGLLPKGKNAILIGGSVNPFWWISHHQYEFGRLIFRKLRSSKGEGSKVWPTGRTCAEVWPVIT